VDELRVAGGGARLEVLGRIKADALGRPVLHLDADTAAVGTALLAAAAAGAEDEARAAISGIVSRSARFEPDPVGTEVLRLRAERFDELMSDHALHAEEP
jgi:sugar (pentulose or hexulose) kinase